MSPNLIALVDKTIQSTQDTVNAATQAIELIPANADDDLRVQLQRSVDEGQESISRLQEILQIRKKG